MNSNNPIVTIVTPTFNAEDFIQDTYESIFAQTETNWEWFVIDDGSQDNTVKIIEKIMVNDSRVLLKVQAKNKGAAIARNIGIRESNARFISFLDADDRWRPEKLTTQLNIMLQTGAGFTYAAYDIIDLNGNLIGHKKVPRSINYNGLLKHNVIGCLTAMYDTEVYGKVEMPNICIRQDYGLWLKLLKNGSKAYSVPGTLAIYRRRPKSLSSNKALAAIGTWHVFRNVENFGFIKSIYYFSFYFTGTILQRVMWKIGF